jgi:hypothetical protein
MELRGTTRVSVKKLRAVHAANHPLGKQPPPREETQVRAGA